MYPTLSRKMSGGFRVNLLWLLMGQGKMTCAAFRFLKSLHGILTSCFRSLRNYMQTWALYCRVTTFKFPSLLREQSCLLVTWQFTLISKDLAVSAFRNNWELKGDVKGKLPPLVKIFTWLNTFSWTSQSCAISFDGLIDQMLIYNSYVPDIIISVLQNR